MDQVWYSAPPPPTKDKVAGPDGSFVSTGACNVEVPGSNPGRAEYCGCAYTVLQTVQRMKCTVLSKVLYTVKSP